MAGKYTEAQAKASMKYKKKLSHYSLEMSQELYMKYKIAAQKAGLPFRQLILQALDEKIERDGLSNEED